MHTKNELINAYGNWVLLEIQDGRMVYYTNLMFEPLKGHANAITGQMHNLIEKSFYPELCKQLDRHPGRKGRHVLSPHVVLVPDLPTFKNDKKSARSVTINRGLHYNGFISISPKSRLRGNGLIEYFARTRGIFARLGFRTIHAEAITHDPHGVMDY